MPKAKMISDVPVIPRWGKADFSKYKRKGKEEKLCLLEHNVDFSNGCMNHVPGQYLEFVLSNNGRYGKEFIREIRELYGDPKVRILKNGCDYCYATRKNFSDVVSRTVNEYTVAYFENLRKEGISGYFRLGKNVEAGHPVYFSVLMDFLDLCIEYPDVAKGVIFPTKSLAFGRKGAKEAYIRKIDIENNEKHLGDFLERKVLGIFTRKLTLADLLDDAGLYLPSGRKIASKLKKANAVVNFSIGYDNLELGADSQGATNEWRIRQARHFNKKHYFMKGVNTTLTVTCDITQSIEENVNHGSAIMLALESGLPIRILPLRITSNNVAKKVTGRLNKYLIFDHSVIDQLPLGCDFQRYDRPMLKRGNSELFPYLIHPDFRGLYKDGIGFCGEGGDIRSKEKVPPVVHYCDRCRMEGTEKRLIVPSDKFIKVEYDKKNKRGNKYQMMRERQMRKLSMKLPFDNNKKQ